MSTTTAQAIEQGYLLLGSETVLSAFGRWCKENEQPLIYAKRQGKYAHVEMDLIFCDRSQRLDAQAIEKVRAIYDYVSSRRSNAGVGPVYSYIDHVEHKYIEFIARAYLAIFKQYCGIAATVPAFPQTEDVDGYVRRMAEVKEMRYVRTHTKADRMGLRWKSYCEAYHYPFIQVHEARRGTAEFEAVFPLDDGQKLTYVRPEVGQAIADAIDGAGFRVVSAIIRNVNMWSISSQGLRSAGTVPTHAAMDFAEKIVAILDEAGHFPSVDESWHE